MHRQQTTIRGSPSTPQEPISPSILEHLPPIPCTINPPLHTIIPPLRSPLHVSSPIIPSPSSPPSLISLICQHPSHSFKPVHVSIDLDKVIVEPVILILEVLDVMLASLRRLDDIDILITEVSIVGLDFLDPNLESEALISEIDSIVLAGDVPLLQNHELLLKVSTILHEPVDERLLFSALVEESPMLGLEALNDLALLLKAI